jgi:hypothetical protein
MSYSARKVEYIIMVYDTYMRSYFFNDIIHDSIYVNVLLYDIIYDIKF